MLKGFKKMSKGKKAGTIIILIAVLALVAYVAYNNFKPKPLNQYSVTEVYKGDIQTTYETSGTVMSNSTLNYTAATGVKVVGVNVSVGDKVKQGDMLASFDVTPLNSTLAGYRKAYNKALEAYNQASKSVADANSGISTANADIASLDGEIAALQAEIAAQESSAQTVTSQETQQYTQEQLDSIMQKLQSGGFTPEEVASVIGSLQSQAGSVSREDIEKAIENSVATKRLELAQKQAQRQMLETQIALYKTRTDDTAISIYKSVLEQKKADYDNYKAMYDKMANGWVAESDGVITEVNLVAGEVFNPTAKSSTTTDLSSILGYVSGNADMSSILNDIMGSVSGNNAGSATGIVLENSDEFIAEFSVGKYDLLSIKTGQKVTVSSLGSTYEGEVIYVSATATESNSLDISSLASTFTGGSSSSSNGALVRVKILKPDEKIIIGFDVDIKIDTEKIEDVLVLPIDAVVTEDGVNYAYVVDEENKVHKTKIEIGSYSDDDYELVSGIEAGQKVVDNPKTTIKEDEKIAVKAS